MSDVIPALRMYLSMIEPLISGFVISLRPIPGRREQHVRAVFKTRCSKRGVPGTRGTLAMAVIRRSFVEVTCALSWRASGARLAGGVDQFLQLRDHVVERAERAVRPA